MGESRAYLSVGGRIIEGALRVAEDLIPDHRRWSATRGRQQRFYPSNIAITAQGGGVVVTPEEVRSVRLSVEEL
jgi:hypothetical protein